MSEVSCRTTKPLVDAVRDHGLPVDELVRGLPFPCETLENPSNRIAWDDFTVLIENVARVLGGPDELESIACRYYNRTGSILGAVAASVVDVRPLYHIGARWYGPTLYASTRAVCEDLPDGRIRQLIEILPRYRDSQLFFRGMRGALRSTPVLLGQPLAEVEMDLEPKRGIFTIKPPPALSLWERLRRVALRRHAVDAEVDTYYEELKLVYEQARTAHDRLDTQTRRLEEERSERERVEHLLQQAQKLDAMGRLAGGIAHDFNNVLTAITGYAELALERVETSDPLAADLSEIRAVSERGAGLVKQILAFSRRQMLAPQRLELNSVILGMETMLSRLLPEDVELVILPSPAPMLVLANPGQIEQVVVNLVVNARDAMPGGGRITLELRPGTAREIAAGSWQSEGIARLEVRDSGRGMDRKTLDKAFEPFFTTKRRGQGTGLGLAMVRDIVGHSGGTIRLESEVGKGTSAIVELPTFSGASAQPETPPASPAEAPGGDETVLVVEDETTVRTVMRRTLEGRGYTVLPAGDAEEALEVARSHSGPIDLLVTDIVLPGLNGRALAGQVDTLRPELRGVVFVSGHAQEALGSPSLAGRHTLLRKPFDAPTLLGATRRVLDS